MTYPCHICTVEGICESRCTPTARRCEAGQVVQHEPPSPEADAAFWRMVAAGGQASRDYTDELDNRLVASRGLL